MLSHKNAIARLFQDDDPETVRLVKEQLAQGGKEIVDGLQELVSGRNLLVSKHATDVLNEIKGRDAEDDFTLTCHFFSDYNGLENACWTLSRSIHPEVDTQPHELQIKSWGRQFLMRSSEAGSNRERVQKLAEFIHGELGFQGNTEDYYNEKNSLLPCVMEMRKGIPISLTLIYMFLAERAGMKVCGVNLPGHFIARHGEVLFDPFHRGKILNKEACEEILHCQDLVLADRHLHPATPRQILVRVLANLLYVYDLAGNQQKHAQIHSWLKALTITPIQ